MFVLPVSMFYLQPVFLPHGFFQLWQTKSTWLCLSFICTQLNSLTRLSGFIDRWGDCGKRETETEEDRGWFTGKKKVEIQRSWGQQGLCRSQGQQPEESGDQLYVCSFLKLPKYGMETAESSDARGHEPWRISMPTVTSWTEGFRKLSAALE